MCYSGGPGTMPSIFTAAALPKADGLRTLRADAQQARTLFLSPCQQRSRTLGSCDLPGHEVRSPLSIVSHRKRSTWFLPCEWRASQAHRSRCRRAAQDTARETTFFRDKGEAIFQNLSLALELSPICRAW